MADLTAEEIAKLHKYLREPQSAFAVADALILLPRLLDEVEETRALLKRIEWSGYQGDDAGGFYFCPECEALQREEVHKPGCKLAARLGK